MDLTPQTLRDVEFREKLRGYHPDDVDDFLEEVAVALDGVLARLRSAEAGAAGRPPAPPIAATSTPVAVAPAPPPPAPAPPAASVEVAGRAPDTASPASAVVLGSADQTLSEGTLSRALILAQRTADLAIAEAEESARQLLDSARAEADRILAETQSKVAAMTAEARGAAEASVLELEQRRGGLEREVASLQSWASQHRDRLREVLSDQLRSLDIWLATSAVPRPAPRLASPSTPALARAAGPADEATALHPVVSEWDATPSVVPAAAATAAAGRAETTSDPSISEPAEVPAAVAEIPTPVADVPAAVTDVPAAASFEAGSDGAGGDLQWRRSMVDSPAAAVSEAVEAGAAMSSSGAGADGSGRLGGGGDGIVLFDQDGEPFDDAGEDGGARMAGRFFRQR